MKALYKILLIFAGLVFTILPTYSQTQFGNISADKVSIVRNGAFLSIGISLDLSGIKVKSEQAAVFQPLLANGVDTLLLDGVGVYGKTRWIQYERARNNPITGPGETAIRYSNNLGVVDLNQNVDYSDWMNGATLYLKRTDYGCAGCKEQYPEIAELGGYTSLEIMPEFQFAEAIAERVKTRELAGRAYVDFPVNKTVIYPDYRNNTYELGKIIATIDSVKNDPDITVTSIHIAGTASPEGPYENNVYLAKNRTIALKDYVTNLYNFPKDFIQTSYEPVDWKGLREWLETNNLEHKEQILAIVNSDIEPYARNLKIKTDYPQEYQWLLLNVYPALRHSDYIIRYQIREYSDIAEIAELIKKQPQKLSLNEMYRLAATLEPGSDEYNEVFEVAVRMYPDDEVANINAANSAMMRKDLKSAEKYLQKAGNSEKAEYARKILETLKENTR